MESYFLLLLNLFFFFGLQITKIEAEFEIKVVYGCTGYDLILSCNHGYLIMINKIVLGDSNCYGSNCCPTDSDCVKLPSQTHVDFVHEICDNKDFCSFNVAIERIGCNFLQKNDFERVQYYCFVKPSSSTLSTSNSTSSSSSSSSSSFLSTTSTPNKKSLSDFLFTFPHDYQEGDTSQRKNKSIDFGPDFLFTFPHDYQEPFDSFGRKPETGEASQRGSKSRDSGSVETNTMIVFMVLGLILMTIIVSSACVLIKKYRLTEKKLQYAASNRLYGQPMIYSGLIREHEQLTSCPLASHPLPSRDTYDFIRDSNDSAFEDGYLRAKDIPHQLMEKKNKQTEDGVCCSSSGGDKRHENIYQ